MRISDWSSDVCSSDLWLAAQPAREQRRWVRAVQRQRLEFLGMVDFFARHPDLKVPKVLAPITAHYSWSKGLKLLGLGRDQLELLPENRSEEHTSELQSLMRLSYAVFCLKKTHYKNTLVIIITHII